MALTTDQILNQMIAQLRISDPDLSLTVGSPEWKILATVAEVIAGAQSDQNTLQYQYDIDTLVGSDLDKFVALFGFARQGGNKASGTVTFSTSSAALQDTVVPVGTTVSSPSTSVTPSVSFITTGTVILYAGTTSVDAPVEAVNVGLPGNVAANTITQLSNTNVSIISGVTNSVGTSGGTEIETDAELRVRFKNTVLRNISGTTDQFLALALSSQYTNKANVIGPLSRFIEYLQVPSSLTMTSQIPYSKYTYPFDYFLTQTSIGSNEIYFQPEVDYSFTTSVPPSITILNPDPSRDFTVDSVLTLEHTYCSSNSRNTPSSGINNYVDVFVDGADPESATDSLIFPGPSKNFTTSSGVYYSSDFVRANTLSPVVAGNRFQQLLWQPVYLIPSGTPLTIQGNTYYEGTDYWFVKDIALTKGSKRAMNGLELGPNITSTITSGTSYTYTYTFNELPITLNELMDAHKQITTDVLVHQSNRRYFNINLIMVYTPGFSKNAVDSNVTTAMTNFFEKLNFGPTIEISTVLENVHEVPGIENVRLARAGDGVAYGIQEVAPDGITQIGQPYVTDFTLQDSDIAVLNNVISTRRSANTWIF